MMNEYYLIACLLRSNWASELATLAMLPFAMLFIMIIRQLAEGWVMCLTFLNVDYNYFKTHIYAFMSKVIKYKWNNINTILS